MGRKWRTQVAIALWARFASGEPIDDAAAAVGASPEDIRAVLQVVADCLPGAEREVFLARYCQANGPPETLASLADRFGVSRELIRLLEIRALRDVAPRWETIAGSADAVLLDLN